MYFDVVLAGNGTVLFNGTPEETKKYIKLEASVLNDDCRVIQGTTLRSFSLRSYLEL